MKVLDCRGLACPEPVIQAKKAMEELGAGGTFSMELDSEASRENVRRFAESRGADVHIEEIPEGAFRLIITADEDTATGRRGSSPVVFVTGDTLGRGDDKLGRILMEGFINTLVEQDPVPDKILLMNSGVKLTVEGSPTLDVLGKLTDMGCEILVCGTCLDFFSLMDKLAVGTVSNMFDIQGELLKASSVVRP